MSKLKDYDIVPLTHEQAMAQAVALLEEEANQLALLTMNEQKYEAMLPHRARQAISREIRRLREIARVIAPVKTQESE